MGDGLSSLVGVGGGGLITLGGAGRLSRFSDSSGYK